MKIVTPEQMNLIDKFCSDKLGLPSIILMENAALSVVHETEKILGSVEGKKICLVAGKGNNGGDAFAAARHLFNRGADITVYICTNISEIRSDALINLEILSKLEIKIYELADVKMLKMLKSALMNSDLVIDGIFGTGIKGDVIGLHADIINLLNLSGKKILSIDIPSGISGKTGKVMGTAIKAIKTVTFCLPKIGLILHPGCEYAGKLVIADIGIPKNALNQLQIDINIIDSLTVGNIIPKRFDNSNKGNYGKVMIVSGSNGMTGSGCLCARASLRTGSGLAYLGVPSSLASIYGEAVQEPILIPLDDDDSGYLSKNCKAKILENLKKVDTIVAGPGLSVNSEIEDIINSIIINTEVPLVLDADALNAIAENTDILKELKAETVITPHPGEMARLTGMTVEEVQADRIKTACDFTKKWNVITVLKGSRTIVALPDGTIFINTNGNAGMSTAGMGDILSGIIASLIGQGVKPSDAAIAGVYIHGAAGDAVAAKMGMHGMIASDVVEMLPYMIKQFTV